MTLSAMSFVNQRMGEYLNKIDPEGDRPWLSRNNEGGEQGTHIRGQDDECRPDVDLTCPLMKEEHVIDEHKAATLRHRTEKSIENPGRHEGLESFRPRWVP